MYDINKLRQELSAIGKVTYCDFSGDRNDSFLIIIDDFTPNSDNIVAYYSITNSNLPDFTVNQLDITNGKLKSDLKKID